MNNSDSLVDMAERGEVGITITATIERRLKNLEEIVAFIGVKSASPKHDVDKPKILSNNCQHRFTQFPSEIAWGNTKKWLAGDWYPLPVGFIARDQKEYIIEGYKIFCLDISIRPGNPLYGDVDIPDGYTEKVFIFSEALDICERHNVRKML